MMQQNQNRTFLGPKWVLRWPLATKAYRRLATAFPQLIEADRPENARSCSDCPAGADRRQWRAVEIHSSICWTLKQYATFQWDIDLDSRSRGFS